MGRRIVIFVSGCIISLCIFFLAVKCSLDSADVDYIIKAVEKLDGVESIVKESMLHEHIEAVDLDILLKDGQEIYVGGVTYKDKELTYRYIFSVNDCSLNYCLYDSEKQVFEVCATDFRDFFSLKNKSLPDFIDKICFQPRLETYLPVIMADDFVKKQKLIAEVLQIWSEDELKTGEKKYFLRRAN